MHGLIRELVLEALLAPLAFVVAREAATAWVAAHEPRAAMVLAADDQQRARTPAVHAHLHLPGRP